jgi:hypothetical protein
MRVRVDSQRIRLNHRAAVHLRISAWRAKFYPGARRYAVRPTHVTVSAVDHFVSDQPCKASTTPCWAAARHVREKPLRETFVLGC